MTDKNVQNPVTEVEYVELVQYLNKIIISTLWGKSKLKGFGGRFST